MAEQKCERCGRPCDSFYSNGNENICDVCYQQYEEFKTV